MRSSLVAVPLALACVGGAACSLGTEGVQASATSTGAGTTGSTGAEGGAGAAPAGGGGSMTGSGAASAGGAPATSGSGAAGGVGGASGPASSSASSVASSSSSGGGDCSATTTCTGCYACATAGDCAEEYAACQVNPNCPAFGQCIFDCCASGNCDAPCFGACNNAYPGGQADFQPLRCCVADECPFQCPALGTGC